MKASVKYTFYVVGATLLLIGLILSGFWKVVYHHLLANKLRLYNDTDSQSFTLWNGDSAPLYFNIYMFNWTNPEDTLSKKQKPEFTEVGPYVFRIRMLKDQLIWNKNGTVSFRQKRRWDFVPERSNGSLSDEITSLNVVALAIANDCKYCSIIEKIVLNSLIEFNERSSLHIVKTAKELLFDGYRDKMLNLADKLRKFSKKLQNLPDKFAWYYQKNITESDFFNMHTGELDMDKLGLLHSWNYSTRCNAFWGDCDQVSGSSGDLWPLNAASQTNLGLYVSDFCGHIDLTNVGSADFHDISAVQFEGTEKTFDNGTMIPETRCYCPNDVCQMKSGVRNVSRCVGAPIFISFPHFYAADAAYRDAVIGMSPNANKHKFRLTLQQDSGLVMEAYARLQINVLLEPINGMKFFANVPRVFMPAIWFEEYVELTPDLIEQLRHSFITIPRWFTIGGLVFVLLGALLLAVALTIQRLSYETIPYAPTT